MPAQVHRRRAGPGLAEGTASLGGGAAFRGGAGTRCRAQSRQRRRLLATRAPRREMVPHWRRRRRGHFQSALTAPNCHGVDRHVVTDKKVAQPLLAVRASPLRKGAQAAWPLLAVLPWLDNMARAAVAPRPAWVRRAK